MTSLDYLFVEILKRVKWTLILRLIQKSWNSENVKNNWYIIGLYSNELNFNLFAWISKLLVIFYFSIKKFFVNISYAKTQHIFCGNFGFLHFFFFRTFKVFSWVLKCYYENSTQLRYTNLDSLFTTPNTNSFHCHVFITW